MAELISVSLLGAFLYLDTTIAFQMLVSQPIIAGTIIGWFSGNIELGLHIGFLLQLLWVGNLPVGAASVPAGNIGSIVAVAMAILLDEKFPGYSNLIILLSVLYGVGLSYLGSEMVTLIRNWNVTLLNYAFRKAEEGQLGILWRLNLLSLISNVAIFFVFIFITLYIGYNLSGKFVSSVPVIFNEYAKYTEWAVLGAGAGLVLPLYKSKNSQLVLLIGGIIGMIIFYLT
ncbi:MAG: PTS sugar transporter subunit IIC [Calditrichaceae bacterium]